MTEDDVSRETPPMPEAAWGVFPVERRPLIERYVALLATEGVLRGLIGPRETPRLWERHVLNSVVLGEAVGSGATLCDVGTGAGLPGLVLAIARPDLAVTLVEPSQRRVDFLSEAVGVLGLESVSVVRARADELHGGPGFDVVTSRAVASLGILLDWCLPLTSPTGVVLAQKGQRAEEEIVAAAGALRAWRAGPAEILELGRGLVDPPARVVRVAWAEPSALSWPPTRSRATPTTVKARP